jgi:hypothetical protein
MTPRKPGGYHLNPGVKPPEAAKKTAKIILQNTKGPRRFPAKWSFVFFFVEF